MSKTKFMCPLCSSNNYHTETNKRLQDPVSKIYISMGKVRVCQGCGLIVYKHPIRGWEGGMFDEITNKVTYHLTHEDFRDGIKDYIQIQKYLPRSIKSGTQIALPKPISPAKPIVGTLDKSDIYYYRSSLSGTKVLYK